MSNYSFVKAKTSKDYSEVIELFKEYERFLGFSLEFQNFEKELNTAHIQYGKPKGSLFLIKNSDGSLVGCAGIRDQKDGFCELKRMYIQPKHQGHGLGKKLLEMCIEEGINLGYKGMRLDSLDHLAQAIRLYKKAGFYSIPAYCYNPFENVLYFEKVF